MRAVLSRKLRKIANDEMAKLNRSDQEVITSHMRYLELKRPKLLPRFLWKFIIKKVIHR